MKNNKYRAHFFLFTVILLFFFNNNLHAEEESAYQLKSQKVQYIDENNTIIAYGEAEGRDQYGKEIFSDKIIYYKTKSQIETFDNSKYKDLKGNIITADNFFYDLKIKKIIASGNVTFTEKNGNKFNFSKFTFFEKLDEGIGENARGYLSDKSTVEGDLIEINNKTGTTIIKPNAKNSKNNYTTCENKNNNQKKIEEICPDWSITTSETKHDRNKQTVFHKNAFIKLRNIPVFYTPYFSHPDSTVERKSGFLTPSIKNFNNLGNTIKTPYFWAANNSTDITFIPILYSDENSVFLSEIRKQNNNSKLHIDTSYSEGYKEVNKKDNDGEDLERTNGSRSHFFLTFNGSYDDLIFENNEIEINIERISQKNYLKVHQINTELVKQDINALRNNFILNSYENNKRIQISSNIYENLDDDNPNTKYSYKIPSIEYSDLFYLYNQNINLNNYFEATNSQGDSKQILQTNIIQTSSDQIILKNLGISNIFKTKFSNINTYNENIINEKENLNNNLFTTFAIENSLPFARIKENTDEIITPKIFSKFTSGSMINASDTVKILDYSDIYSMDRLSSNANPETGASLGYGVDYNYSAKNLDNNKYFEGQFSIGQILKNKNTTEMPATSSLNKKQSDFVGNFNFYFNKAIFDNQSNENQNNHNINFNYEYTVAKNLNKILKNNINVNYNYGTNYFTSNFYELNEIGSTHYVNFNYIKKWENSINFKTGLRKNLDKDYTENNYIELNYESDCLKIGINLAKTFYENEDFKADNNLTLFVMLKPFGQPVAPDLSNLID